MNCLYCHSNLIHQNIDSSWLQCFNHPGVSLSFLEYKYRIKISNHKYTVFIYHSKNDYLSNLSIYTRDGQGMSINGNFFPNITPENFENKLDLLIAFQ